MGKVSRRPKRGFAKPFRLDLPSVQVDAAGARLAALREHLSRFGLPRPMDGYEGAPERPTQFVSPEARRELKEWAAKWREELRIRTLLKGFDPPPFPNRYEAAAPWFGGSTAVSVGGPVRTWNDADGKTYIEYGNECWVGADKNGDPIRMNDVEWAEHIGLTPRHFHRLTWLAMTAQIVCDGQAFKAEEHVFGERPSYEVWFDEAEEIGAKAFVNLPDLGPLGAPVTLPTSADLQRDLAYFGGRSGGKAWGRRNG